MRNLTVPADRLTSKVMLELPVSPEMRARYLGEAASALYLIRPDQIVAARWLSATPEAIAEALTAIWEDRT